ncbi:MAG: MerR family transcriptional regulator [Gammaproteobacteria bacterium]|nr:MerR family transcriptional regulator [Gammaproteobacteria bacterium]
MLTIGRLARQFGLSRSSLLYYDRIGLLRPSGRSDGNYRLYTPADVERLARIALYREAGLPLASIGRVLAGQPFHPEVGQVLEERLAGINGEIAALRRQQQVIVRLLNNPRARRRTRILTRQSWTALLRSTGLTEADMRRWHVEFERRAPEAHQDFLESLGIDAGGIREIRRWSRQRRVARRQG